MENLRTGRLFGAAKALCLILTCALCAACGGGGGSGPLPAGPAPHSGGSTPQSGTASVSLVIAWPQLSPSARKVRPAYISPSTTSVTVAIDGAIVATLNNPCTSTCPPTVTTSVTSQLGFHRFAASSYDGPNATGNKLSTSINASAFTVTSAGPNVVPVTMNGIVSSVGLTSDAVSGSAGTVHVQVVGYDVDGNVIKGATVPYANPIALTLTDTLAGFSGSSPVVVSSPGTAGTSGAATSVAYTYNGATDCAAYVSASAPSVAGSGGGTFLQSMIGGASGNIGSTDRFGRVLLCWNPLSTVPATTSYNVFRGTAPGGESPTPLYTIAGAGANSYSDYLVYSGTNYFYKACSVQMPSACSPEISGKANGDAKVLAGASFWFDANDANTITASAGKVSSWADKSGNGRDLTQAIAANQMTYSAGALGGRSAVQSSPNTYMTSPSGMYNAPATIVAVANQLVSTASYQRLVNICAACDGIGFVGTATGAAATFFGNGNWNDTLQNWTPIAISAAPAILAVTNDGTTALPYTTGVPQGCNGCTPLPSGDHYGRTVASAGFDLNAFGFPANLSQAWQGDIAEIVYYPSVLSVSNRQLLEGYLACKWGFQNALPVSHPYSSSHPCP